MNDLFDRDPEIRHAEEPDFEPDFDCTCFGCQRDEPCEEMFEDGPNILSRAESEFAKHVAQLP